METVLERSGTSAPGRAACSPVSRTLLSQEPWRFVHFRAQRSDTEDRLLHAESLVHQITEDGVLWPVTDSREGGEARAIDV